MLRVCLGTGVVGGGAVLAWLQRNYSEHSEPLAAGSKIIVIGAGVAGCCTAYELARANYQVEVIEAGPSAASFECSASWGNAGTLGVSNPTKPLSELSTLRDILTKSRPVTSGQEIPGTEQSAVAAEFERHRTNMFLRSAVLTDPFFYLWGLAFLRSLVAPGIKQQLEREWLAKNQEAQRATFALAEREGITRDCGMKLDGRLTLAFESPEAPETHDPEALALLLQREGPFSRCMGFSPAPGITRKRPRLKAAALSEEDGKGSCSVFCTKVAEAARDQHDVRFVYGQRVSRIALNGGRVSGVVTSEGDALDCDAVVVCAGSSSASIASSAGVYVPVQPLIGYSLTAAATETAVAQHIVTKPFSLYITRIKDQIRFTCYGELGPVAGPPTTPSPALQQRLRDLVEHVVPGVREACAWDQAKAWSGARPLTPDCLPLVGATRVPGLFLNTGHGFNGWRDAAGCAVILTGICKEAALPDHAMLYSMRRFQPAPGVTLLRTETGISTASSRATGTRPSAENENG